SPLPHGHAHAHVLALHTKVLQKPSSALRANGRRTCKISSAFCSADNASWQSTVLYHDGEQSKPLVQALFVNRAKAGTPMATIKAQTAPAAIGFKNDYERARKMLKAG